jgi:hypothetical protein
MSFYVPPSPVHSRHVSSTTPGGTRRRSKTWKYSSSKYDFVKVRVWLDEHYFVLSRFLTSRGLTAVGVPYEQAIKISLELKKRIVDSEPTLDVKQAQVEEILFRLFAEHGYSESLVNRYKLMSKYAYVFTNLYYMHPSTWIYNR